MPDYLDAQFEFFVLASSSYVFVDSIDNSEDEEDDWVRRLSAFGCHARKWMRPISLDLQWNWDANGEWLARELCSADIFKFEIVCIKTGAIVNTIHTANQAPCKALCLSVQYLFMVVIESGMTVLNAYDITTGLRVHTTTVTDDAHSLYRTARPDRVYVEAGDRAYGTRIPTKRTKLLLVSTMAEGYQELDFDPDMLQYPEAVIVPQTHQQGTRLLVYCLANKSDSVRVYDSIADNEGGVQLKQVLHARLATPPSSHYKVKYVSADLTTVMVREPRELFAYDVRNGQLGERCKVSDTEWSFLTCMAGNTLFVGTNTNNVPGYKLITALED